MENQEKYKLYLENENGNRINLDYSGRVPNVGETIIFDMSYTDFEELMIKSRVVSRDESQSFNIASLNDRFNGGREYVVTNVKSTLEFKLNELNLVPFLVEARVE